MWRCLCVACAVFGASALRGGTLERHEFEQLQMGTWFRLVIYAETAEEANGAAAAAFARIEGLNASLSDYRADSEISRLSDSAGTGAAFALGPDVWEVLQEAQAMAAHSDGAFDVTIGPLVRLWREARTARALPGESRLRDALRAVGHEKMRLDPVARTATLTAPGMRLDFGGIAKGYAADCAYAECSRRGLRCALVSAAGDIVAGDPPPGQDGWRVGLPDQSGGETPGECVLLAHGAISTSGDQFQFLEIGGRRYSHLIDPRTGMAVTNRCTVTVAMPGAQRRGATADALASAASVLGPERGMELIARTPGAAARIVRPAGGGILTSPGFSRWRIVPR